MWFKSGERVRISKCSFDFLPYANHVDEYARVVSILNLYEEISPDSLTVLDFDDKKLNDNRINIVLLRDLEKVYYIRKKLDPKRLPK